MSYLRSSHRQIEKPRLGLELLEDRQLLAVTPQLVKDINTSPELDYFYSQQRHDLVEVNGNLFFPAYTQTTGFELWKSGGTQAGTQLVKDIRPGTDGALWRPYNATAWAFFPEPELIARNGSNLFRCG